MGDLESPKSIEGSPYGKEEVTYDFFRQTAEPERPGRCRQICCSGKTKTMAAVVTIAFLFMLVVLANNNADNAFRYTFTVDMRTSRMERDVRSLQQEYISLGLRMAELEGNMEQRDSALEKRMADLEAHVGLRKESE